jgi:HK97 family phage major capsid protein
VTGLDPKIRELRQLMAAKIEEARKLAEEGKIEEARAAKDAAKALKTQVDELEALRALEEEARKNAPTKPVETPNVIIRNDEEKEKEYRFAFVNMLRGADYITAEQRAMLQERRAGMNSTSGQDGGFLIPPDIQTQINLIKRQYVALEDAVTSEPVTTLTGSRVLEKYVDITPFANIAAENTTLADLDNPQVSQVSYNIKDYGGIMTLTNNLLADSPENILAYVSTWIARKDIITDNSLILAVLEGLPAAALAGIDDIKKAINVTLDPMISANASFITNQDAFNFLDEQKDGMGRPLIQPNPTQPSQKMLFGKPILVMANRLLPTTANVAPFFIGDFKSACVVFDRQEISILTTNIGGGAFENNVTKMRVIVREDVKPWDTGAGVYGSLTIA